MKIETVTYGINWKNFKRGHSFFVPCINPRMAKAEINRVTRRLGFNTVTKVVIEEGIQGLRVWRV